MKNVLILIGAALILFEGPVCACSILEQEKVQVGSRKGVKGVCSNNGLPVTCIFFEGTGIECDGPSGGYTGYDLDSLVFSACGCTTGKEKELLMKEELGQPPCEEEPCRSGR